MVEKTAELKRAIKAAGSGIKLAAALGIKRQAITAWHRIPLNRVFQIERITGIPHRELRPDFFGGEAKNDDYSGD